MRIALAGKGWGFGFGVLAGKVARRTRKSSKITEHTE
jgi:hypothetical protein